MLPKKGKNSSWFALQKYGIKSIRPPKLHTASSWESLWHSPKSLVVWRGDGFGRGYFPRQSTIFDGVP